MWPFGKKLLPLNTYNPTLGREELIRKSRILVIDDEKPDIIDDLHKAGFAVDYDANGDDTAKIEKNLYDLILLDFGGVGSRFGEDQGLSLLRHLKRVNPAVFILAYTSKRLSSDQSDFFRLTDATLAKDSGVQEALEKVESSLIEALSVERMWKAILQLIQVSENSKEGSELEKKLLVALSSKKSDGFKKTLADKVGGKFPETLISVILDKMIELALRHTLSGGA